MFIPMSILGRDLRVISPRGSSWLISHLPTRANSHSGNIKKIAGRNILICRRWEWIRISRGLGDNESCMSSETWMISPNVLQADRIVISLFVLLRDRRQSKILGNNSFMNCRIGDILCWMRQKEMCTLIWFSVFILRQYWIGGSQIKIAHGRFPLL